MRVCIVGSGIAGLSAAFHLTHSEPAEITIFEQATMFGGRANVTDGGEHCARLFLDDYSHLLAILSRIETVDGRTVAETLRSVMRYWHSDRVGWIAISHLYPLLASEVPLRDKLRVIAARRRSPLLAEQKVGENVNRYGSRRNYSGASLARMAANFRTSTKAYALPGPTDRCLIDPWVRHLRAHGVELVAGNRVEAIAAGARGVRVDSAQGSREFDAVLVTAFISDAVALLDRSGLEHSLSNLDHTHCKVMTLDLDPAERVLGADHPAIYSRDGIAAVVQPESQRCVVLCLRPATTDTRAVLAHAREMLGLEHSLGDVRVRDNQRAEEAIFVADYNDPLQVLVRPIKHLYFAGSCMRNSYPVDSGEGAARSAANAIAAMRRGRTSCMTPMLTDSRPRGGTMSRLRYTLLDRALSLGLLPDALVRAGSRYEAAARVRREGHGGVEAQEARLSSLVDRMSSGPIAVQPAKANEQHYELPAEFLGLFLGPRRKYSGCLWAPGVDDLGSAEEAMLELTCRRAGIRDGMRVLDLGCGWGALSIWLAERYDVDVLAVSNSHGQRQWIESERDRRALSGRLEVVTADVNEFDPGQTFDRVVSVEMFEHMRNWAALLGRVASWLTEDGRAFVHVFSHRRLAYRFEDTWAAERFFTEGTMPSHDLLHRFSPTSSSSRSAGRWAVRTTPARCRPGWSAWTPTRTGRWRSCERSDPRARPAGCWRHGGCS